MKPNHCSGCHYCDWRVKDPLDTKYRYSDDRKSRRPACFHAWCNANLADQRECLALALTDTLGENSRRAFDRS